MNETLSREEQLFDAARQVSDPAQRRAYLAQACDGDDALRARVEALLESEPGAEQLFHDCAEAVRLRPDGEDPDGLSSSAAAAEEMPGAAIGPYRIISKIGEGGCGVVCLAEQERPVRRRVAIKIIKLGMDTRAVVARFNAERQALAMMDHPNIAKVFDAGATGAGRPYFVMEFVGGQRITDFCDKERLNLAQRLDLFTQVCHAIQHAHQKGVIHRDIKPSNILVGWQDGHPAPKVIDFGVAKATEERLTDKTILTLQTQLIGTPAYMSPEQAEWSGLDIDTRSDIYSLGALLCELLTSRTPFDTRKLLQSGVEEWRRVWREVEPAPPSATLQALPREELAEAARRRGTEPQKLVAAVRGDLDCIVLKALEKDRARRYETVNGMAKDAQRYLANEPIAARPPNRLYQFEKLVRRNKGVFAALAVAGLAMILALAISTSLWQRETQARRRAVAAEQREAQLRHDAEAREKITHTAFLLNNQKMTEADALAESLEIPGPTVEGAAVFRGLGEWHGLAGRWAPASRRFQRLVEVDAADGWDLSTLDFLEDGVALVEAGDEAGYRRFHEVCFDRFGGSTNLVIAERMLKINLLWPGDRFDRRPLEAWARVATQPTADESRAAWRAVSLSLYEYRRGNDIAARQWAEEAMNPAPANSVRTATAQVIEALALQRMGQGSEADRCLREGHSTIEGVFRKGLSQGNGDAGFWFDWVFAEILLQEAAGQPGTPAPAGP